MNKQDNKLALSVLATLTTGLALIYILIMYRSIIAAVAGISVLFLITAFILTKNLIAFSSMKDKSINVHIKNSIDDISAQLEMMNNAQTRIGKANYIRAKQTAEILAQLENNYAESQMVLCKNLTSISNLHSKATRLMIKYDQNNTTKLVSTIKDMRNQLNETMIQGFDQIQPPNNSEIISILEDITTYLKSQPEGIDQELSMQLSNIAQELQSISDDIRQIEIPAPTILQTVQPDSNISVESENPDLNTNFEENMPETTIGKNTVSSTETIADKNTDSLTETTETERINPLIETFLEENTDPLTDTVSEEKTASKTEETSTTDSTSDSILTSSGTSNTDPNKQLSSDEIAALFAEAEPAPKKEKKPAAVKKTEPKKASPANNDSSKQLSADEIAALFAAAEPVPKKEEETPQIKTPEPVLESTPADPNKPLSADEIAALFSSMG